MLPVTSCGRLEGRCANARPQPPVLRHAGYTAEHLKSWRDGPGDPEVVGANRGTPGNTSEELRGVL